MLLNLSSRLVNAPVGTRLDLPPGRWHDVLTGVGTDGHLADLLATHPVALLVREDA